MYMAYIWNICLQTLKIPQLIGSTFHAWSTASSQVKPCMSAQVARSAWRGSASAAPPQSLGFSVANADRGYRCSRTCQRLKDPNVRLSQFGTPGYRSYVRSLHLSWRWQKNTTEIDEDRSAQSFRARHREVGHGRELSNSEWGCNIKYILAKPNKTTTIPTDRQIWQHFIHFCGKPATNPKVHAV